MKKYFVMTAQEYALYLTEELEYIERNGAIYRVSPAPGNEERAVPGLGVLAGWLPMRWQSRAAAFTWWLRAWLARPQNHQAMIFGTRPKRPDRI